MGKPILQIPEAPPTELLTVEFSALEERMYQQIRDRQIRLREQPKVSKSTNGPAANCKGELKRLFDYLRFFTSHAALVEPGYLSSEAPPPDIKTAQPRVQNLQPNMQAPTGIAGSAELHYFCRLCCNVLVEPYISKVRASLPCPARRTDPDGPVNIDPCQCGHAFCRSCLKKKKPCVGCGEDIAEARPGGDECYHHSKDQFADFRRRFSGAGSASGSKRNKRVRKPGDDEFGLQPRLAQPKAAGKRKRKGKRNGKGKNGKKNKGQTAKKKDDTVERMRENAGSFLRMCDKKPWEPVPHSAKTRATLDLVRKW